MGSTAVIRSQPARIVPNCLPQVSASADPALSGLRKLAALAWLTLATLATGCGGGDARSDREASPDTRGDSPATDTDSRSLNRLAPGLYQRTWTMPDDTPMDFVISVPSSIQAGQPVPLVLALHFGSDRFTRFFGSEMLVRLILPGMADLQAVVVAPDMINKSWTNDRCEQAVMALLNEICKTYPIDRNRVLVTGYSLGGRGTWHFASRFPDFFTAAIPIAGRPPLNYAEINWTVPMLCIQSTSDEVFPIAATREAIEQLNRRDLTVQLYELDQVSHYESMKYIEPLKHAMDWAEQVWDARSGKSGN